MELKESCGVFGIWGHKDAVYFTFLGLYALQHRGQESAGIVSFDRASKEAFVHKGMGLVADVFDEQSLSHLPGDVAIGHVRYSTTGSSILENAQPLLINYKDGFLAIGHNGNLINSRELRRELEGRGAIFQTSTDSEVIVHLIAHAKRGDWLDHIFYALRRVKGAYSLVMLNQHGMMGVRDPYGFRPLVLGEVDGAYILASESCALDLIGAKYLREVEPGELVLINDEGLKSFFPNGKRRKVSQCVFEHIYFARPDSLVFGRLVHEVRKELGKQLAREHPVEADMVIPVPDSGLSAAIGYSQESGIPLEWGFIRNHYVGRTFIQPHQRYRDLGVRIKLNIMPEVVRGKRVIVVDDSIVRGTTSRRRVRAIRNAGAKEVHLRISCPPHRWPCFYGIDFPSREELIANKMDHQAVEEFLNVDSLGYLSLEGMLRAIGNGGRFCTACFSGKYPIPIKENLEKLALEQGRIRANRRTGAPPGRRIRRP